MPHHQVWKQKGEEYRLFGGGGWVWTSGLQCRKRKRPRNEKDTFGNKKRKLLDTTNKIVTLREKKKAEALKKEQDKAAKIAAQQASSQKVSLPQEKSAATPQGVQTKSTTTTAVTTTTPVQNTLTLLVAPSSTSSALQNAIQTAPSSTSTLLTQSSAQTSAVASTSSPSNSSTLMITTANTSTASSAPVHFVPQTLSCTATSVQSSVNPSVHSTITNLHVSSPSVHSTTKTINSQVLSGIPSAVPVSSSSVPPSCTLAHTTSQPISSVALPVLEEPPSSKPGPVVPVLSSQAESTSTNLLSKTVSSSLKMTADSSTNSSVSEPPSITKTSSIQILPTETSSTGEIPSSVVQVSSSAPSSTSLVTASSSAVSLSSSSEATLVNNTLASSGPDLCFLQSVSAGPPLSSSSVPTATETTPASTLDSTSSTEDSKSTDCVSTEQSVASSVSTTTETVNDSVDLLDSSASVVSSETTSEKELISLGPDVSETTDVIKKCDSLLPVVTSYTDVNTRDNNQISKLCTEDVSIDCPTKDTSIDGSSIKDSTEMTSGKETSEDQEPFSSDSPLNVSDQKSQSAVCKSLDSDQSDIFEKPDLMNMTPGGSCAEDETVKSMESRVAQMSSNSIVTLPEKETLVDGHQDTGILDISCKVEDVDDFSGSQAHSQESEIVASEDDMDKKDSENACENTTEAGLTKEGQKEKPSSLESQLCKATDGEESKQNEDLTELSDVHVVNHDQENIVHEGSHEASTKALSSVDVVANSDILGGLESLKPEESLDSKDGQIQEKEEEIESVEELTVNNDQELREEQLSSNKEGLLDNQLTGSVESGSLTTENKPKLDDVLLETEKESNNHFEQMAGLEEGMKGNDDVVMKDGSLLSNNVTSVENDGDCTVPKSSSDNLYSENLCNHDEKADASATEKDICTTASKDEKIESSASSSSQAPQTAELTAKPANHYSDEQSTVTVTPEDTAGKPPLEESVREDNEADVNEGDVESRAAEGTSCLTAEAQDSKSVDSTVEVSSSSDCTAVTTSVSQASVNADPKQSGNQEDEPMDVDVVSVSPMEKSSRATTLKSSSAMDGVSCSQVSLPAEKTSTSETSHTEVVVREEGSSKLSKESLPVPDTTSQTSTAHVLHAVSTVLSLDKTASPHSTGTTTSVSSTPPTAVSAMLSSQSVSQQSIPLPSGPVQGVSMTASPSTVPTASTAAAVLAAKVTSTSSISMQPVVSGVPGVAKTGPLSGVTGGSPMVCPSIQTTLVKSSPAAPAVQNTSVRVIHPQKASATTRPQGQTTQYVPIGPKPILPSPRPPVQSTGIQGSNVVRVSAQPTAVGQSTVGPVKSIAALVASLPASGATIGPSQLIRLVTPDGRSITLQGSQLAAIAQQAGSPLGLAVPKSITLQVSGAAVQHRPITTVQRTAGTATPGATITVQRPQQQAAQVKTQIVVKPKVVAKPIKEEKFPSLEPLIKDPRALLNRRLAKWPLRHSVKSVFTLRKHELKRLGRKAGMKEVSGYVYSSRAVGVNWPAGIPRPSFKVAWRFRTQSLKTLAGAGLQLRVLQSCLKWDEMNVRPPRGNSNTVYTSSGNLHKAGYA